MSNTFNANYISTIGVIGLGYVGIPLAKSFSKYYKVIGYDIDQDKIQKVNNKYNQFHATLKQSELLHLDVYFITVPTPVDRNNNPDLSFLRAATKTVGRSLKTGAVVVYESTVYPGTTEEICIPILEKTSGLVSGQDFKVGYSPERITPGIANKSLEKLVKIISGQDIVTLKVLKRLYSKIIKSKLYEAPSIKVAEAAKILENIQRDVNIALINEFAIICNGIGISTKEVLKAATTKWNFTYYEPGLVGGHCISVDPYYLSYKASQIGIASTLIDTARKVNNSIPYYIFNQLLRIGQKHKLKFAKIRITFLGCTFKENCDDIRNSKIIEVINETKTVCKNIDVYDPLADAKLVQKEYGIKLSNTHELNKSEIIILGVCHKEFLDPNNSLWTIILKKESIVVDIKSRLSKDFFSSFGCTQYLWQL